MKPSTLREGWCAKNEDIKEALGVSDPLMAGYSGYQFTG
jgi:hypothetical protein